jgi:hypothetical protein
LFSSKINHSVIDEVVVTMMLWNKVSPAFLYLDDDRFGVDEWAARIWCVISDDLLQILTFCVLIRGNSWLAFDVAMSTPYFGLLNNKVWHHQNSVTMVKDCKPAFLGGFLS